MRSLIIGATGRSGPALHASAGLFAGVRFGVMRRLGVDGAVPTDRISQAKPPKPQQSHASIASECWMTTAMEGPH